MRGGASPKWVIFEAFPTNFRKHAFETVRIGSEGPTAQAYRPPEGPCHAPYTGQIHARSVARTPFRTVS